jgi:hypothetical protein
MDPATFPSLGYEARWRWQHRAWHGHSTTVPSYTVFTTIDVGSGIKTTIPYSFADASGRSLPEIVIGQPTRFVC